MADRAFELRGLVARTRSDASLFDRALRGDAAAFSEVYRRYHPRIYALCLSRSLDPALAEDAAQETFVRFLKAQPTEIESPRAWLFTVARNVSVDLVRQRSRIEEAADDPGFAGVTADSSEQAAQREQGREIMLALRRLRPRYRSALILRELHGLSSAEMAEALGTSPGAVDTLVSRARDAFGRLYSEVSDLPEGCRSAFPLIYKRLGSGLDAPEQARLDAHLAECPRCRAEAGRASRPGAIGAMLPLLVPLGEGGRGAIGQLLATLDPTLLTVASTPGSSAMQHVGIKVAAVALAVTAVAAVPASHGIVGGTGAAPAGPKPSKVAAVGAPGAGHGATAAVFGGSVAAHGRPLTATAKTRAKGSKGAKGRPAKSGAAKSHGKKRPKAKARGRAAGAAATKARRRGRRRNADHDRRDAPRRARRRGHERENGHARRTSRGATTRRGLTRRVRKPRTTRRKA